MTANRKLKRQEACGGMKKVTCGVASHRLGVGISLRKISTEKEKIEINIWPEYESSTSQGGWRGCFKRLWSHGNASGSNQEMLIS